MDHMLNLIVGITLIGVKFGGILLRGGCCFGAVEIYNSRPHYVVTLPSIIGRHRMI